ncbi:DUF4183 domain-containing protein [Paenibacillus whitsoniae]|uniref:DUF4183 domain-containing protein n=1 Tax=Paenibacillus whitsoniae TaxID=2496558 RepID=A0A3S0AB51_9BACL|nr:DUF4183 domain-containing protein [Paenibacillus whitsoniae]RTE08832.1 DUF4183 domain-containing protein [Paenibacillus whitsoniae]
MYKPLFLTACRKRRKRKNIRRSRKASLARYLSKISFFYTTADGDKRVYTESDRTEGYGKQSIPCPATITYTQLFVNGVLQPSSLYHVQKGTLTFLSNDVPEKGVPIILQCIRIYKRR